MVGAWLSLTVMVKVQEAVVPAPSIARNVMVVVPVLKVEPLAAPAVCETDTPEQLSVGVGVVNVTTAVQSPASVLRTILDGQVIAGASLSTTVTVKVQDVAGKLAASVAVKATVVVPFWKTIALLFTPSAMLATFAGLPLALPLKVAFQAAPVQLSDNGSVMV